MGLQQPKKALRNNIDGLRIKVFDEVSGTNGLVLG